MPGSVNLAFAKPWLGEWGCLKEYMRGREGFGMLTSSSSFCLSLFLFQSILPVGRKGSLVCEVSKPRVV